MKIRSKEQQLTEDERWDNYYNDRIPKDYGSEEHIRSIITEWLTSPTKEDRKGPESDHSDPLG